MLCMMSNLCLDAYSVRVEDVENVPVLQVLPSHASGPHGKRAPPQCLASSLCSHILGRQILEMDKTKSRHIMWEPLFHYKLGILEAMLPLWPPNIQTHCPQQPSSPHQCVSPPNLSSFGPRVCKCQRSALGLDKACRCQGTLGRTNLSIESNPVASR